MWYSRVPLKQRGYGLRNASSGDFTVVWTSQIALVKKLGGTVYPHRGWMVPPAALRQQTCTSYYKTIRAEMK